MPESTPALHRVARPTTPTLIVVAIVAAIFAVAFASGFYTNRMLDEARVQEQATQRFKEFISVATDLGIVTVDHQRLDELTCIATEGADAAEQEKGDEP